MVINGYYQENVGHQHYSQDCQNHQKIYSSRSHPNDAGCPDPNYSLATDLQQRSNCSKSSKNIPTVEAGGCQEFHRSNFPTRPTDFHQFPQQYNELEALSLTPENFEDAIQCRSKNSITTNGLTETLNGQDMEDEDDDVIIVSATPASNNLERKIHSMRYEENYMSSYVYPGTVYLDCYLLLSTHPANGDFIATATRLTPMKTGSRARHRESRTHSSPINTNLVLVESHSAIHNTPSTPLFFDETL